RVSDAVVANYTFSLWLPSACAGWHPLVGSTLDHPEMLWGIFEHVNNTPIRNTLSHEFERSGHAAGGRTWRLVVHVDRRTACQSQYPANNAKRHNPRPGRGQTIGPAPLRPEFAGCPIFPHRPP